MPTRVTRRPAPRSKRTQPPRSPSNSIFERALNPESAVGWQLGLRVAQLHPGRFILDGVQAPFNLQEFADEGMCTAVPAAGVHAQLRTGWTRLHGLASSPVNAVFDVTWRSHHLRVVKAEWMAGYRTTEASLVVADTQEVARAFAQEVCAFCNEPRRAVLRFSGGCWSKSPDLYAELQAASFDDLVLAGDLKERIREDFSTFLNARAEYERYGVPHKRGVLFTGPPGNGKTHCLRAVIKFLAVPCLYVLSIKDKYSPEDENIDQVFQRAREVSPCCLVFEDLDAMITDKNRSYFLNQLDGLGSMAGVLTLATTNHPERLDPAIVDRPSRFDRKYHFGLPSGPERLAYLQGWNARLDPAMHISDADVQLLVEATHGFSFAYLKELYLSSMVRWMAEQKPGTMDATLRGQLDTLRAQMRTEVAALAAPPVKAKDKDDDE